MPRSFNVYLACLAFLSIVSSFPAAGAGIDEDSYSVYVADIDLDGYRDYVLVPKKRILNIYGVVQPTITTQRGDPIVISGRDGSVRIYDDRLNLRDLIEFDGQLVKVDKNNDGISDLLIEPTDTSLMPTVLFGGNSPNPTIASKTTNQPQHLISGTEFGPSKETASLELISDDGSSGSYIMTSTALNQNEIGLGAPEGEVNLQGATSGKYSITREGALSYRIPIHLPKATGGHKPSVNLVYSSDSGNGLLGMGWRVSGLSSIHRCEQVLAWDGVYRPVMYDSQDKLCLDGERLVLTSGVHMTSGATYAPRKEDYSRIKILSHNSNGPLIFEVQTRSGETMTYGLTSESRLQTGGSPINFQWSVNSVSDKSGNTYSYKYNETTGGELLIEQIDFTENTSLGVTSSHAIKFSYIERLDLATSYVGLKEITRSKVLEKISVEYGSTTIREYRLRYSISPLSQVPKLSRVQECGVQLNCFSPTTFSYANDGQSIPASLIEDQSYDVREFATDRGWDNDKHPPQLIDLNGDGQPEIAGFKDDGLIIATRNTSGGYDFSSPTWNANGFTAYRDEETTNDPAPLNTQYAQRRQFIDLNDDNLPDILAQYVVFDASNSKTSRIYIGINNGSGFNAPQRIGDLGNTEGQFIAGDINNDGLTDLLKLRKFDGQQGPYVTNEYAIGMTPFLQTENGDFEATIVYDGIFVQGHPVDYRLDIGRSQFTDFEKNPYFLSDVNGDYLPDVIGFNNDGVLIAYGNGESFGVSDDSNVFTQGHGTMVESEYLAILQATEEQQITDANGDGKVDLVAFADDGVYVALNKDPGFSEAQKWSSNFGNLDYNSEIDVRTVLDINSDGYVDVIGIDELGVFAGIGNGSGFSTQSSPIFQRDFSGWTDETHPRIISDLDGDGMLDLLALGSSDGFVATSVLEPSKLTAVSDGMGNVVEAVYGTLLDPDVYEQGPIDNSGDLISFRGPKYVVAKLKKNNGRSDYWSTSYFYRGYKYHKHGFGVLGFEEVIVEDTDSNETVSTTYSQAYQELSHGLPLTETQNIETSALKRESIKDYEWSVQILSGSISSGNIRFSVRRHKESEAIYGRDSATAPVQDLTTRIKTWENYDGYGNPRKISNRVIDEFGEHISVTVNEYVNDSSSWSLGLVTRTEVTNTYSPSASPKNSIQNPTSGVKVVSYSYDIPKAYLKTETVEPDSDRWSKTTFSYNVFGQVDKVEKTWAPAIGGGLDFPKTESFKAYDPNGRYIIKEYVPTSSSETSYSSANVKTQYVRDPKTGLLSSKVDANGQATSYTYDAFGRETRREFSDGTWSTTSYSKCDQACFGFASYYITEEGAAGSNSKKYFDKLGRLVEERFTVRDGFEGVRRYEYDFLGRKVRQSEPFFLADGPAYWTEFSYDPLDRVTETRRSFFNADVGIVQSTTKTKSYDGLSLTLENELSQRKVIHKNSQGKTVAVVDDNQNSRQFGFDSFWRLARTVDAQGNESTFGYDVLGNKSWADDPDKGRWDYQVNALRKIYSEVNAKGETTAYEYDQLGRKIGKVDNSQLAQSDPKRREYVWTYDSAQYGKGKIHKVVGPDYEKELVYDVFSREGRAITTIDGQSFSVTRTYDSKGRVEDIVYPTGLSIRNEYDSSGYLKRIIDPSDGSEYWAVGVADSFGNINQFTMNDGLIEINRVYDDVRGRLHFTEALTRVGGQLQSMNIVYDGIGNVIERKDNLAGVTEQFDHDNINRLVESRAVLENNGQFVLVKSTSLAYDSIGNIISKSDVGTYSEYGGVCNGIKAGPHAVTEITGVGQLCYDENGNRISGNEQVIEYYNFGKPRSVTRGSDTTSFRYGPDRNRFERVDSSSSGVVSTLYIGGMYERVEDGSRVLHKHYIGDLAVVIREAGVPDKEYYLIKDNLGSTDLVVDQNNSVVEEFKFDVWGNRLTDHWASGLSSAEWLGSESVTTAGFTGQEHLSSVNLIHMNGRAYDPLIGRFLTADPVVQDSHDPEAYNRYSYVRNNPVSFTDPSGFSWLSDTWDKFKDIFEATAGFNFSGVLWKQSAKEYGSFARKNKYVAELTQVVGCSVAGPLGCAAASASVTYGVSQDFHGSLRAGAVGFVSSYVAGGVDGNGGIATFKPDSAISITRRVFYSAVAGGATAAALGGDFSTAALSGAGYAILNLGVESYMTPTADDRTLAGLSRAASRGEMRVGDYVGEHWETPSGFEAVLYHNHSISDYVAVFVGTNDRRDILVDLRHAFGVETKHYSDAMEFAKHAMETSNETARFVGHSLGGSLAMAAQAKYGSTAVTFNSAGLNSKAVSGSVPTPGAVRNFYSAFDILQPVILLAPSRIYGPSISVGPAGFHGIKAMADGM